MPFQSLLALAASVCEMSYRGYGMKFLRRSNSIGVRVKKQERGIALITALLLLALLTALSVAMYVSVNSDAMTSGYYKNFRGSFYAADSGLAVVRQDMKDRIWATMVDANSSTPPLATSGVDVALLAGLKTSWASDSVFKPLTSGSSVADSVPIRFRIEPSTFTFTQLRCFTDVNPLTCDGGQTNVNQWNYIYQYHMVSVGQAGTAHLNRVEESGTLTVTVPVEIRNPDSFAGYGMYVTTQAMCSGSVFAPGKIYGPVYTGNCFTFGTGGTVTYTDPVRCNGPKAGYQFSGKCVQVAADKATYKGVTIAPAFGSGIYFNQDAPTLPKDSFNQKHAVIDAVGAPVTAGTWQSEASGQVPGVNGLRDVNGNLYPATGAPSSGVYLAYDKTNNTISGGGIYVAGNAGVTLSTATTGDGKLQQTYTIVNGGVTTKITYTTIPNSNWNASTPYDPPYTLAGQGTITIQSGSTTLTLNNTSTSKDKYGNVLDNATMLYVDGNITSLSGAVQDDTALTITAAGDVTINADLKYKSKPITTAANEIYDAQGKGLPADSVIAANNKGQALGVFTANGNVITTLANQGNLEVDASLATISEGGDGGLVIPNSSAMINNLTIIGGRINNTLYSTSKLGSRSVFFDRRFGRGLTPPFFPATDPGDVIPPSGTATVQFQRQQWINQTAY